MEPETRDSLDNPRRGVEISVDVPGFAAGGRVDRTGIALVHEGEYIVPAAGSDAVIASGGPGGHAMTAVVNYYFPVEIELAGEISEREVLRIAERVFESLRRELESRI